ncbi:hypothetical protein [Aeromonas hydrophila]
MSNHIEKAKKVLTENSRVPYGIFGVVRGSGFFPPRFFLNEFLSAGSDPCDQDGRMASWIPFELTAEEYLEIIKWWVSLYPNSIEDALSQSSWQEWSVEIIERC